MTNFDSFIPICIRDDYSVILKHFHSLKFKIYSFNITPTPKIW